MISKPLHRCDEPRISFVGIHSCEVKLTYCMYRCISCAALRCVLSRVEVVMLVESVDEWPSAFRAMMLN